MTMILIVAAKISSHIKTTNETSTMKWLFGFLSGLVLFYLSLYPMLAMQIYSPSWY